MKIKTTLFGISFVLGMMALGAFQPSITIYTIGDSTMSHYDSTKDLRVGWADGLGSYFNSYAVIENDARSGRSSKSFIDEGLWTAVINKVKAGDYVFIQFGHNDEKTDVSLHTDPYTTYSANLIRFVTETRAKGGIPVLFTSICRRNFGSDGILKDTHGDYPPAMRKVADSLKVLLVDMTVKTTALVQSYGPDSSKKIYNYVAVGASPIYPSGNTDDTHINKFGAFLFAGLAVQGIRDQKMDLAAYLNVTAVRDEKTKQNTGFFLEQNYPNPFNPSTIISYILPAGNFTTLKVFDTAGREIAMPVSSFQAPGTHHVSFSADNLSGGVYFYTVKSGSFSETRKMLLLR